MVRSNLAVLVYVYAPHKRPSPAVINVPVRATGLRERLALTNTLALTPGSLAIQLRGDMMAVHVLDIALAEGIEDSVRTYERLLEKALG